MTSRQNLHFSSRVNTLAPHPGLNYRRIRYPGDASQLQGEILVDVIVFGRSVVAHKMFL